MNYIKILGASGSKTQTKGTTSFQIYKDIIVDAGNVINSLGDNAFYINHIFLTHSHSDHIIDLPFLIEGFFEKRKESLIIYASKDTINALKKYTFNNVIWPDFSKINLINSNKKAIVFKVIKKDEPIVLGDYVITAIKAKHIKGSFGYEVIKDNSHGYIISGDTYKNKSLIKRVKNNDKIKSLIIECSFPNRMEKLAKDSQHLTPKLVADALKKLHRKDVAIFLYHLKPLYLKQMKKEISDFNILENGGKVLEQGDVIHIDTGIIESDTISHNKFEKIMDINLELSSQYDRDILYEKILKLTRELTRCEAGTLYLKSKDNKYLEFKVIQNDPLNFNLNTKTKHKNHSWSNLPLYHEDGSKNLNMVATVCALKNKTENIPDVYTDTNYDFSGTKKFDKSTGYRSKSMLVIPLINHEQEVIGVLQLINKTKVLKKVIDFNEEDEKVLKALASQAAMALTNTQLINSLEDFLNSFITTIAQAIDAKSPHTMNHIGKVEKIALLLANAINKDNSIYKDVKYSNNDLKQIELAAWMHDIGKISMPESIIDKSTKLQSLFDRIEIIKERFEILKRDLKIDLLTEKITKNTYQIKIKQFDKDIQFLEEVNIGGEFLDENKILRIGEISKYTYVKNSVKTNILSNNEKENLSIEKGTLTQEEKTIMNNHAKLSYEMLSSLPFPKKYNRVLDIAVNHHEKLNGKGYPRGLKDKDLTLEDKIMILADIFEALTARDRPYKDGKKMSEVFRILSSMVRNNEIDAQLLKFFHEHKILQEYIKEELNPSQNDKSKLDF